QHPPLPSFPTRRSSDLANGLGSDLCIFADILFCPRQPITIKYVRIQRINGHVAVFKNADEMPIAKSNLAKIAAAQRRYRSALLRSEEHTSELQSQSNLV